jgi:hypothetical protein
MTHAGQKGTTGGNSSQHGQRDDEGPPHPSARLPRVCLRRHTVGGHALSRCTPIRYGRIASVSATHRATQFVGPHKIPYVPVHNSNLLTRAKRSVLNQHWQGLPPWGSEFQIRLLPFLPIQDSPFSPNCPTRSPIIPTIWSSC